MELRIERKWKKKDYCIGVLYVNGVRFCETLEDPDRGLKQSMPTGIINQNKVYGETAIPTGVYQILRTISPKFAKKTWGKKYGGVVPEIANVKGYSGVRIHPGNTAKDLLGCVAPGRNKEVGKVLESQATYYKLMDEYIIPAWERGEEITLEII